MPKYGAGSSGARCAAMRYCASASAYFFARYSALPLSSTTRASALIAPEDPAVSSPPGCALTSDSGVFGAGSLPLLHARAAATVAASVAARNARPELVRIVFPPRKPDGFPAERPVGWVTPVRLFTHVPLEFLFRRRFASRNQRIKIHSNLRR